MTSLMYVIDFTIMRNVSMNRKPGVDVIRTLRREVGFGCPVPQCGNPYLEWHHFDPPWKVENHHRPEGMIALCVQHHKNADNGAYTKEQLIDFKKNKVDSERVRGNFEWRRNKLLVMVGGNFYYEVLRPLVIDNHNVISTSRDEDGYLMLSIKMLSKSKGERLVMSDNFWDNIGHPTDFRCPPSGKEIEITYDNNDYLSIEFYEITSGVEFRERFNTAPPDYIEFPITISEINLKIPDADIILSPGGSNIATNVFKGNFFYGGLIGMSICTKNEWLQNWDLVPNPGSRVAPCPCGSGKRYKKCHGKL